MEVYIGTSGWVYDWNPDGLEWYARNTGLNAVELNMSFYRFPYPNMVKSWARKGSGLRWSVKVHRSITHLRRLKPESLGTWWKFKRLFQPMDSMIDFYLFQLPPQYTCTEQYMDRLERFQGEVGLAERFAVEFRNETCFNDRVVEWARRLGITLVSVDSPQASWVVTSNGIVYLRLHGREVWYGYDYSEDELRSLVDRIMDLKPARTYVFFNNDHWMLGNATLMQKLFMEEAGQGGSR